MMDVFLLSTGFLLYWMLPCISSLEGYWDEFSRLRNNMLVPDTGFTIKRNSSLVTCVSLCLMTDGCCFVSYIAITSECVRHSKWLGYQLRNSASVWNVLKDDGCPCGWYRVQTSCFLIIDVALSWHESVTYCQVLSSRLAEVDTEPKDAFLRSYLLTKTGIWSVWIGGSDAKVENTWLWTTSGLPITTFTNWHSSQPDDWGGGARGANCICMGRWHAFLWNDCNCFTDRRSLVCEKLVMLRNL